MFTKLRIEGFRACTALDVPDLARVNLFVGRNNIGKTTLLEAVQLLAAADPLHTLIALCARRGERAYQPDAENRNRRETELAVANLFAGRTLKVGASVKITGYNGAPQAVEIGVIHSEDVPRDEGSKYQGRTIFGPDFSDEELAVPQYALKIVGLVQQVEIYVPLSASGGISEFSMRRQRYEGRDAHSLPLHILTTEGHTPTGLAGLLDRVVLEPGEDIAVKALRIIEANVERIAAVGSGTGRPYERDVVVRMKDNEARVSLGSFGEGMRRLLGIALSLPACANGILLADEIDTGLHYGTLEDLWRLIIEAASKFNIQVFATTHSGDCVRALGYVCQTDAKLAEDVRLHRVEAPQGRTVAYSGEEMAKAAKYHIELRG